MQSINNGVLIGMLLLLGVLLFQRRLLAAPLWRATVTPPASIIGSGFLVAGPLLAHPVGNWAWLAMLGLCGLGYWFGAAIRYNIRFVEPSLAQRPPLYQLGLERFSDGLPAQGGETAIIGLLRSVGTAVAPLLILTALASQLSAAVADMNGAGGLLAGASAGRLPVRLGNLLTALVAIAITWTANIYEIITYASKMFVIYYALQALQATLAAWPRGERWRACGFAGALLVALGVMVFAKPVVA
jgi:hypothetical protein